MDFSEIINGLSTATVLSSMIAAAALIAIVGFAMWAGKKVASFFDDGAGDDNGAWGDAYDYARDADGTVDMERLSDEDRSTAQAEMAMTEMCPECYQYYSDCSCYSDRS